ncbi:MAG: RNA polymerase sigma-70 factor [Tannerellaceae bacterium]|nr:RNA polymerase sigma-70 factor [Tannerellaceae bacterium]
MDATLTLFINGDENAYRRIFNEFYSPLCEYASHYIGDMDAEEVVQELMVYLWENKTGLVIETSLKSYLFAATRNRCLNVLNKESRQQEVKHILYEKIKDRFEDPDFYLQDELTELISKTIHTLPDTYRETFALSRLEELTNAEIAELLDISVKTVEYRISQALKILRIQLRDYLPLLVNVL